MKIYAKKILIIFFPSLHLNLHFIRIFKVKNNIRRKIDGKFESGVWREKEENFMSQNKKNIYKDINLDMQQHMAKIIFWRKTSLIGFPLSRTGFFEFSYHTQLFHENQC